MKHRVVWVKTGSCHHKNRSLSGSNQKVVYLKSGGGQGKNKGLCLPLVACLKSCFSCRMLDDFSHEMDNTQSRLDNVMKKLAKVSHMTSGNQPGNT